jgi:hypothetical protein
MTYFAKGREARPPITIATLFWDANEHSLGFSKIYDETWVEKIYRGFARNLTVPFRFVCFVDRSRTFAEPIIQERITHPTLDYGACIEPYRLDVPMILVGLDTVIVGNCDALARYALDGGELAVPRDPYKPTQACNGVALVPAGKAETMWTGFDGRNDMDWIRANEHVFLDDIFPGACVSYKGRVMHFGLTDANRIVYFHGDPKPPALDRLDWIRECWR